MNDTREYIITTSLKLFLQKNFKEVTMKEIVKATGLSKGAFYHYFESKEKVFEEVVKSFYNNVLITDYTSFPTDSLKNFYTTYLDVLNNSENDPDVMGGANFLVFLSDAARKIPAFMDIHNAQREKEILAWANIAEVAENSGEIASELPSRIIAEMFLGVSDGVAMQYIFTGTEEASQKIKEVWDGLYSLLKK